MKLDCFERLTRPLFTVDTRRGLLQLLPLAGGLGALSRTPAAAKERKAKKICKKSCGPCKRCQKGKCKKKLPNGTACVGGTCQSGRCIATAAVLLPSPHVCAGRNAYTDLNAWCGPDEASGCFCFVTAKTNEPFCGYGELPFAPCSSCIEGETCIRWGPDTACSPSCPPPAECSSNDQCPGSANECEEGKCRNGRCYLGFVADGTPIAAQTAGDCQVVVCDGNGDTRSQPDDADLPDDGQECTGDTCNNGTPEHAWLPLGYPCNGNDGQCDGLGNCVRV